MGDADFLPVRRDGERAVTEVGELAVTSSVVGSMAVVRPEEVAFEVEPDGPAQVVDVEFRGPSWHYTLRLDSGTVLRSSRARETPVEVGTRGAAAAGGRSSPGPDRRRGVMEVVVVGGGPCGLTAALGAARAGRQVALLEASSGIGGMAASFEVDGQRVDHGSHRLHPSAAPAVRALLDELLGT